MIDLYTAALALADQGVPVFPCNSLKRPIIEGGFLAATVEPQRHDYIDAALIGVPTWPASGFDCLDIDPRHGGDAWLAEHRARLPVTRTQTTQSGGLHFLFRADPDLRCSVSKIAPGVDVRGGGG